MRFTIRQLILIFPAYFLATSCAAIGDRQCGCIAGYPWGRTIADISQVRGRVNFFTKGYCNPLPSVEEVNQWLAHQPLPTNHPLRWDDQLEFDGWGRPYRCVWIENAAESHGGSFGVYSLGRDGISRSEGNDPDDLNSWNHKCYLFYVYEIDESRRISNAITGAIWTPIAYCFLLVFALSVRKGWRWLFEKRTRREVPVSDFYAAVDNPAIGSNPAVEIELPCRFQVFVQSVTQLFLRACCSG